MAGPTGETDAALIAAARAYFVQRRARVPGFVRERFSLRGTVALHRHALGWGILRAPANMLLLPVLVLARLGAGALSEYGGTRSAMAEVTTALGALGAGAFAFHALTPGMLSLAPGLAAVLAQQAAIAAFPLGGLMGSAWYGLVPAAASPLLMAGVALGLFASGALAAAFAGVIADPVQAAPGLHERRLNRLIDAMEDAFAGTGERGFAAREHYLARLLDLSDSGLAALRAMSG
ncbi:DUF6635 family protein [Rhodovulum sp.]|uniref:DUF6635 family protein n=1 Tax=Rhodovulum sp. TaxID=34009 RepID=UPI001811D25B|nr:DUF6635 family protein [Rhodovulum sp.]HDR27964.1 hypothetical protein [Rhodovulum sp.]